MARSKNNNEQNVEEALETVAKQEVVEQPLLEWVVQASTSLPSMIVKAKDKKEALETYRKMLGVSSWDIKPVVTPAKKPKPQ